MDCKVKGSYTYFYLDIVFKVKVLGWAGQYREIKDKNKSISSNILLKFYYKLNFFIIYN